MRQTRTTLLTLLFLSTFAGCTLAAPQATVLLRSPHCGEADAPSVTRISDRSSLDALQRRIPGGEPIDADPAKSVLLLIEMGQQPTTGYGLELRPDGVKRADDGALEIHVDWLRPAEGAMTGQMITNPCLLLQLEATDAERVRVVDQTGRKVAESR